MATLDTDVRDVRLEHAWIPLSDGCRLSSRIWLPADAEDDPVPAVLEYIPYRKDDATAVRDLKRHPYFASCGYAGVRVDMRGSGDSDGILYDEYLRQEQDDALESLHTKEPSAPRADGPPTDQDGVSGTGDLKAVHPADARID